MNSRRVVPCVVALVAVGGAVWAQTPEQQRQMEYERQQREYWRAQEQQRQEQQRQQQIMNENARRQQEEQSRINRPTGGGGAPSSFGGAPAGGTAGAAGGASRQQIEADLDRQRAEWSKRPALPQDRNPLLGRWMRPASTRGNSNDPFAQVAALAKGGACELFFGGGGVFEFRPGALVGIDGNSRPQELDQVEYRGDDKRVIVIPKASFKIIEFHFDGRDRVTWPLYKCTLVRVGAAQASDHAGAVPAAARNAAAATAAGSGPGTGAGNPAASAAANAASSGAVLSVAASFGSGASVAPHAGAVLYVLRHDAEQTLRRGGIQPRPGQSILRTWALECRQRSPACAQGAQLLGADSLGYLRTDAQGKVQSPPIAPGTYYVFTSKRQGEDELFWNQRVELKAGINAVTLDQRNAFVPR